MTILCTEEKGIKVLSLEGQWTSDDHHRTQILHRQFDSFLPPVGQRVEVDLRHAEPHPKILEFVLRATEQFRHSSGDIEFLTNKAWMGVFEDSGLHRDLLLRDIH